MDVESGPDADTPRPIGVGLLLCMLERGGEATAQALIGLAAKLQVRGPLPPREILVQKWLEIVKKVWQKLVKKNWQEH